MPDKLGAGATYSVKRRNRSPGVVANRTDLIVGPTGFVSIGKSACGYECGLACGSRGRTRLKPHVIIDGILEPLFAPKIFLCRLDLDVAQQKLSLLQFASGLVT